MKLINSKTLNQRSKIFVWTDQVRNVLKLNVLLVAGCQDLKIMPALLVQ